jgi:hypothetical protein
LLRRLLQVLPPLQVQVPVLLPEQVQVLLPVPEQVLPLLQEQVRRPDLLLQLHMSFRLQ